VVADSPVAPVRDEVRRIVNETTGDGGSGGGGGGSGGGGSGGTGSGASGSGTGSGSGSGGSTGSGTGDSSGTPNGSSPGSVRQRSGGGRRTRAGTRRAWARRAGAVRSATPPGPGARRGSERSRSRSPKRRGERPAGDGQSAAVRTIETIVEAVPTPIWIALGVLFVLALGLGARTFVERRRARALARDREQLMNDVAVLERALLPAVPERVGALATSVAYRPCDGPAAGGDFYDAFELPDGRAVVLVGDVSGHGPDALEATNFVRSQLHALLDSGLSPRAAIAMVGERAPVQLAGRFTTVVVALHDPAAGTLTYATAGHPPPIIVGPAAEELLSAGASPPIGVGLRTGLRETTVALPSGSLACFYTDGLIEAKVGDGMLGRDRLAEMVESLERDAQALALLEHVVAEADETPDDMAVCLLRPVSGAEVLSPRVEVLELDPDDIESGFAERFLGACKVAAGELAGTIEQARATVESNGRALVEITIADGLGRARVSAADAAAPPTPV
jgi:Stage II sporulation protein E (SpoIIE)